MSRVFIKTVVIAFILIVIISLSVYFWQTSHDDSPVTEHVFKVELPDSAYDIAQNLKKQGIIKYSIPFYLSYLVFGTGADIIPGGYKLSTDMGLKQIIYTLEEKPWSKYITIPPNVTKEKMGEIIGEALDWEMLDKQYFGHTYAGMQWQNYEHFLEDIFVAQYKWQKSKTEAFLTLSSLYYDDQYDFFKNMYVPGIYEIPRDSSRAQVAGILISYFDNQYKDKHQALTKFLDNKTMNNVADLIEKEMVLMPDIVAIPPHDITIKKEGNKSYLLFTTSYWNKGRGPLELVADPKTKGKVGDIDRNVYQRIYHLDGDYTERLSGKFLWHAQHLHYHFQDFAIYDFEPVDNIGGLSSKEKLSFKSTFCVRDSEPIDLAHPGANKEANYKICGKERQGISPGWADSYYYTYIDQKFDITNIPEGIYRLKITINPKNRFDEVTLDNNVGEAIISIKDDKVEVIEEKQYGI